jgi:hypothetical protein
MGKLSFLAGFAAGYVAGAAAGRERYEQIKSVSSKVAGNPTVQRASGTVTSKATELSKTAKDKAADKLPKFASAAASKAGLDPAKVPGASHTSSGQANGTGLYPDTYQPPAPDAYEPPPGTTS